MRWLLPLILLTMLSACRPVDLLDAMTADHGYRLQPDISYGRLNRQKLDVYAPVRPIATPTPVIVFFYGGSWTGGDRRDYRFVAQSLAAGGYLVVIPDYRLYPDVKYPAFLEDGAMALRWVQDHAFAQGGDPRRIFLMGHSAGAYNAAMLALDARLTERVGFDRSRLKGVVGLAGPYDFHIDSDLLRGIFGSAATAAETQPVTYAGNVAPPMLLVVGDDDETVDPRNSESLARHLRESGNAVRLRRYANDDHVDVVLELSSFVNSSSVVRDDILDFLFDPKGD